LNIHRRQQKAHWRAATFCLATGSINRPTRDANTVTSVFVKRELLLENIAREIKQEQDQE
jgi:hypothetical protein